MRGQYETLICPFCDKGKISCLLIAGTYSFKKSMAAHTSKSIPTKSSDVWLIQSNCNICGKTKDEIDKELKKRGII
jgi:hypothetical protein